VARQEELFEVEPWDHFPIRSTFDQDKRAIFTIFDQVYKFIVVVLDEEEELEFVEGKVQSAHFPYQVQGVYADARFVRRNLSQIDCDIHEYIF
jgi:hypothetical protein